MNKLQIVSNEIFGELQVMELDGKAYFPATECAKMLGYSNPKDAIKRHCRWVAKHDLPHPQNEKKVIQKNFIPEGDLYRLIVKSQLPAAEQFERWVFDEVLPDIRKHGMYTSESLLDDILKNPDLGIRLFTEYKEAKEEARKLKLSNAQQKQIIGELQPKASYYDAILQNNATVPITKIAKDYGMSGRAMNALLKELGVQYKMGNTWLLYQQYADQGYTQSRTHLLDNGHSVMNTYWTQKGRLFLYDFLKNERGLLPMIERVGEIA